jgi:predicted ATP-grasp superfamily ATP-dependent carboligase
MTAFTRQPASGGLPAAVVCPLDDHMGLDIARSLSAKGVRVFGVDTDAHVPGKYSNACEFVHCPYSEESDETAYIGFLVEFGASLGSRAVLYPLSDRHVLLFSQYRDALAEHYDFVMPAHDVMVGLTTKDGLDAVSREHGIPAPQTHFLSADTDIRKLAREVPYPAILKPTESTYWHSAEITAHLRKGLFQGRAKVIVCESAEDLISAFEGIARYDPRMIVQEVIPGEDSRLVYAAFYLDRSSQPLGYFSGRKHRVIPTGFGSASFVETFSDQALQDLVLRTLAAVGYQGLGGLEFKLDPRDGRYKLIEFNTRFGMWDGLGVRCGVDLPYLSYRDALGLPVEPELAFRSGALWIDWQRDLRAFLDYRRHGQLTFRQWWRSLRGPKMLAIYSRHDWRPGVVFTFGLLGKLGSRLMAPLLGTRAQHAERS